MVSKNKKLKKREHRQAMRASRQKNKGPKKK